jgi:hypothetical protein
VKPQKHDIASDLVGHWVAGIFFTLTPCTQISYPTSSARAEDLEPTAESYVWRSVCVLYQALVLKPTVLRIRSRVTVSQRVDLNDSANRTTRTAGEVARISRRGFAIRKSFEASSSGALRFKSQRCNGTDVLYRCVGGFRTRAIDHSPTHHGRKRTAAHPRRLVTVHASLEVGQATTIMIKT